MSDNISRKAAKDAIAEKVFHNLTDEFYGVMQVLDELPSTDRTGHWIECDHEKWASGVHGLRCSECHSGYHLNNESILFNWDYCPACGADMRGVDDESTL